MKLFLIKFFSIVLLVSIYCSVDAQSISKKNFLNKDQRKEWKKGGGRMAFAPDATPAQNIYLFTPSVPFSFGRIQKNQTGNWQVSPQASTGITYSFVIGSGHKSGDLVQVEPWFTIGGYIDAGVAQSTQTANAVGSFNVGGVIGFYKYINILLGYDILNSTPIYGIGARVDIFSFGLGAGSVIINKKDFYP